MVADFEEDKRRVQAAADPDAIAWLEKVESGSEDGSLWETPPIDEQLREHFKRLGLRK